MLRFVVHRIAQLILILIGISFLTFSLTFIMPSDPVTMRYESMGQQADRDVIEREKENLGLNKSFVEQYVTWFSGAVTGDFGISFKYRQPVSEKLAQAIPNTLKLAGSSLVIILAGSLLFGILSAVNGGGWIDYTIRFLSFIGVSIPSFWLGMILIYRFSVLWKILPVSGMGSFKHMILPSMTLATWMTCTYIRRVRTGILEELKKDYVTGLMARGVPYRRIIVYHVLPNSLIGIVTMLGISIGGMLGGTVVIETIFGWQGVGKLAMDAIKNRDYPLIQGYVIWMAVIFVGINLFVDIFYHLIDPRIRIGENK